LNPVLRVFFIAHGIIVENINGVSGSLVDKLLGAVLKQKLIKLLRFNSLNPLPPVLRELLKDEAIGGKLILGAAVLALLVANSPLQQVYEDFWTQVLSVNLSDFSISLDLRHWVSEGLMAIFFLVVGLEVKREAVNGQLRKFRTALLPIGAAIGGMIVPAILFVSINAGNPENLRGWAIPIATDIAFALAIMSLLGKRVSSSLKLFLLTLAIVDDIGSILVIALFYGSGILVMPLLLAGVIAIAIVSLSRTQYLSMPLFIILALLFWYAIFASGIHASIAGALLGFLAPIKSSKGTPISEKLEKSMIPVSTFLVVPLFAFASLGLDLSDNPFNAEGAQSLALGIIVGFIVGKVIGIALVSWLLVKFKMADLPTATNWFQIVGVGLLAGVGFTVSVFIADIAFESNIQLLHASKASILISSVIGGLGGYLFLSHRKRVEQAMMTEL
jgi:NhaA family Na+:H+ antiporter